MWNTFHFVYALTSFATSWLTSNAPRRFSAAPPVLIRRRLLIPPSAVRFWQNGLIQRRSCRASSHKPSRPMRIRCISVLHPEGIIKSSTGGRADFHQPPLLHGLRTALMGRSPHPERQHRPGDRLRQVGGTAGHTRCTRWEFHHSRAHLSLLRNGERRNPSWRGPGGHVLAPAVKRRSGVLRVRCRSPPPLPPRLRMPARWENRR